MCGRYSDRNVALLDVVLRVVRNQEFDAFTDHQSQQGLFNIAPSQLCPIVRADNGQPAALTVAKWGLVPSWTKGEPKIRPINARSETAATSGMFRQALERRRCLVPADGSYEWKGAKPPKQPFFIHMKDDSLFTFAGLWERWTPPEQTDPIDTFTILTTTPNALMAELHNRMPVILHKSDHARWLDPKCKAVDISDLLVPCDAGIMEAWPVSTRVNTPKNQGPDLIERVE